MALEISFTQDSSGETGTVTDDTVDGEYPSPDVDREDAANYLLFCKTDKDGERTYDNPEFGDVLEIVSWDVETPVSGLYEAILLRISIFDAGANYVEEQTSGDVITQYASIVYYGAENKVYKAIAAGVGNLPTDEDYFEEVTDLSEVIDNTNIEQEIININSDKLIDKCIAAKFANGGCDCSFEDAQQNNQLMAQKRSAEINFASGNIYEYEKIIEKLNSTCALC